MRLADRAARHRAGSVPARVAAALLAAAAVLAACADEAPPPNQVGTAASWRPLAATGMAGRFTHAAVWTGTEMVVWGGFDNTSYFDDGGAYDPATDTWRTVPKGPLGPRAVRASAVWTGTEMLVWGGEGGTQGGNGDGAAYDPAADSWRPLAAAPLAARFRKIGRAHV